MKRVTCDVCRNVIFDRCEGFWELKRKSQMGNKEKVNICAGCATALIDVIMDKKREYRNELPVSGESYTEDE